MRLRDRRDDACLSDLAIDRWLAGELTKGERAAVRAHAAACERCTRAIDAITAARATVPEQPPARLIASLREVRGAAAASRRSRGPAVAGALAAAAAVTLLIRRPPFGENAAERTKGDVATDRVAIYIQHDGAVREGGEGARVVPGDAIEFVTFTRAKRYLIVLSVDGARRASVYYADGDRAAGIAPGEGAPLDRSTILDGTLGFETLYALFCDHPVPVGPVVDALAHRPDVAPRVPGCTVDPHSIVKESR